MAVKRISKTNVSNGTSVTVTLQPNSILVFLGEHHSASDQPINSVSWNGEAFTELSETTFSDNALSFYNSRAIYYLLNPTPDTGNMVLGSDVHGPVIQFSNVDQDDPWISHNERPRAIATSQTSDMTVEEGGWAVGIGMANDADASLSTLSSDNSGMILEVAYDSSGNYHAKMGSVPVSNSTVYFRYAKSLDYIAVSGGVLRYKPISQMYPQVSWFH